jgi:hypothetical protein
MYNIFICVNNNAQVVCLPVGDFLLASPKRRAYTHKHTRAHTHKDCEYTNKNKIELKHEDRDQRYRLAVVRVCILKAGMLCTIVHAY